MLCNKLFDCNIIYYVQPNVSFPYWYSSNKYINDNKEYKDIGENIVNVDGLCVL